MNSFKCPQCGLTNWSTAERCKRCEFPFQLPNQNYGFANQQFPPPQGQKSGLAIASMITAILGFGCISLVMGIVAYNKSKKNPYEYGGRGFAIAGIVISAVQMFLIVPIIVAIAIPNLLAARQAANEASAIAYVNMIAEAENAFMSERSSCGDAGELEKANLLRPSQFSYQKNGYKFSLVKSFDRCELYATPVTQAGTGATGSRTFYYSTFDGVIRESSDPISPATSFSEPLGSGNRSRRNSGY